MNSRDLPSTSFAQTMVRDLRRMLFPPLLAAAFPVGLCRPGLAQYEALDLVPEQAASTLPAGGVTLFLNVRMLASRYAATRPAVEARGRRR